MSFESPDPVRDEDIPEAVPGRLARRRSNSAEAPLTTRERDALQLASYGFDNNEIARELGMAYHTVRQHLQKAYGKLDAACRTHAVAIAIRKKLIH